MWRKFYKNRGSEDQAQEKGKRVYHWWDLLALPAWVLVCFLIAEITVTGLDSALTYLNIAQLFDSTIYNSVITILVYAIIIFLAIVMPRYVPKLKRYRISRENLGITRYPIWRDILMVPVALIVYFILSSVLILIASHLIPGFNINQTQETGFQHLNTNIEYIFAFITLLVIVPLAEETIFRGYLYGKLRRSLPIWLAVIAVGLLFGGLHGAWNVAIDTFALNIVLCTLRESTGSIWSSVLLHLTKNGIAFYFLFINPILLTTLGK